MNEIQLEEREKELLKLISQKEQELSLAINENNQLEASALLQSYSYFKQERPKQLQNIFAELEGNIYKESYQEILEQIDDFNQQNQSYEEKCQQLRESCERKRTQLLSYLKHVKELRTNEQKTQLKVPQFDSKCSVEVENLVRRFANEIEEVNEEELIALLARGKSEIDMQQMVEKAKTLANLKYRIKCETIVNDTLQEANNKLNELSHETYPNIGEGSLQLSRIFDELSDELDRISQIDDSNEQNEQTNNEEENEHQENLMREIDELNQEVLVLRQRLLNVISSESSIPMPPEISNAEHEKEAMRECIDVLSQSIQTFIDFLNSIEDGNIIDTKIATEDEVREELQRNEELKQNRKSVH